MQKLNGSSSTLFLLPYYINTIISKLNGPVLVDQYLGDINSICSWIHNHGLQLDRTQIPTFQNTWIQIDSVVEPGSTFPRSRFGSLKLNLGFSTVFCTSQISNCQNHTVDELLPKPGDLQVVALFLHIVPCGRPSLRPRGLPSR